MQICLHIHGRSSFSTASVAITLSTSGSMDDVIFANNREQQCADTIGTVLLPWVGHLQCQNINIFLNIRKEFYQTALRNCYGLKLAKR